MIAPPEDLNFRVTGTHDVEWFFTSGKQSVLDINRALATVGRNLGDFRCALDFGCGCGRILAALEDEPRPMEIYGVDIDADAVTWASEHIPYAHFLVTEGLPPLPFPDAKFELVFNHSVLTHLPKDYQDPWLRELRRVTMPGGFVQLTVHGPHAFEKWVADTLAAGGDPYPSENLYRTLGFVYMTDDGWADYSFPDYYHTAFQSPAYVLDRWDRIMRVRAYLPQGALDYQDMVLLERRD